MNDPQITPISTTMPATPCDTVNQLLATIAELRAQLAERGNPGIEQLRTDLAKEVHALDCRVENEMARIRERIAEHGEFIADLLQKQLDTRALAKRIEACEEETKRLSVIADRLVEAMNRFDEHIEEHHCPGCGYEDVCKPPPAAKEPAPENPQEPQSVEPHTLVASKADIDALAAKLDALPDMQEIGRNFIAAFKLLMAKLDAVAEAVKEMRKD